MSTKIGGGSSPIPIPIPAAGRLLVVPSSTPIPILLLPINNTKKLRSPLLSPTTTQYLLFPIGFGLSNSRRRLLISPIKASSSSSSPQTSSSSSSSSSSGLEEDQKEETPSIELLKSHIYDALQGTNRGIFGIPSERKSKIEGLVKQLESLNPTPDPSLHLEKVGGCWKLVYSTITILGSKRTKLGLRDFITLGDFFQIIDVPQGKAVNVIKFNARGFKSLNGELTIEASFKVSSRSRVDIQYSNSKITPDQLMNVFQKNYSLLLGIFNLDGWLEITYVDATMRIGRDDKGNIFILERSEDNP